MEAIAHWLGGMDRLENPSDHFRRHTNAGIRYAQREVSTFWNVVFLCGSFIEPPIGGLEGYSSSVGHSITGDVDGGNRSAVARISRALDQIIAGGGPKALRPLPLRGKGGVFCGSKIAG